VQTTTMTSTTFLPTITLTEEKLNSQSYYSSSSSCSFPMKLLLASLISAFILM
jgi:hypothetical protein